MSLGYWLRRLSSLTDSKSCARRSHQKISVSTATIEKLEARQVLSAGPVAAGPAAKISDAPAGSAIGTTVVAMDAAGDYAVAWNTYGLSGSASAVIAHRYTANGVSIGGDIVVTTSTVATAGAYAPAIAMDAAGDFVVVWDVGDSGVTHMVYAQRYNSAGVAQGTKITVNSATIDSNLPGVAMDATGDFVVQYSSYRVGVSIIGTFVQRYNSAGVAQGTRIALPSSFSEDYIAMDSNGGFIVAGYSNSTVMAERFNSAGVSQGSLFQVYSNPSTQNIFTNEISVAIDHAGDFVIAWQNQNLLNGTGVTPIMAQRFNSAGTAVGTAFQVASLTKSASHIRVVSDAVGNFAVVWDDGAQNFVQSYSTTGAAQGAKVPVDANLALATYSYSQSTVAMDPAGDFVVVGMGRNSSSYFYNNYAQRFHTANPPINHAPVGTSKSVVLLEDTPYVLKATDFGFTDPGDWPANSLLAVKITTLPLLGTLSDNGVAVVAGSKISIADITAGNLKYTPMANKNGAAYASFTFQVQDNGGTANGGVDTDPIARKLTFNVTAVNDAPNGMPKTVTTLEDKAYILAATDFGFTDPNDLPANTLLSVKITTLPTLGTLSNNGVAVAAGSKISIADITAGNLKYTPVANKNGAAYASFTFQVQDNGGTANGGVDTDPIARKLTFNVTAVNDAPSGTAKTVMMAKNGTYILQIADFGFTDVNDSPSNTLLSVTITTLPLLGKLTDNGVAVIAGAHISLADITGQKLKFTPAANGTGTAYASFLFQVQDNGGTANGGHDTDSSPKKLTFSVN